MKNRLSRIFKTLNISNERKTELIGLLSPISDEELDEILNGSSYYYYNDEGIGIWDINEEELENEISS